MHGRCAHKVDRFLCLAVLFVVATSVGPAVGAQGANEPGAAGRPTAPSTGMWLAQVVTDPQTDWDASGKVTSSDEYVVLHNAGSAVQDLAGWRLLMEDSTPSEVELGGAIAAGGYLRLLNPVGQMNNDVRLVLTDAEGVVIDVVSLEADGVPSGNAVDDRDEAVHLVGAWAAQRSAASGEGPLGPHWVETVRRAQDPTAPRFTSPWATSGTPIELWLVSADAPPEEVRLVRPDGTDTQLLRNEEGWWSEAVPGTAAAGSGTFQLIADNHDLAQFPGRGALAVRPDDAPPEIVGDEAVQDGTGAFRFLPGLRDDESGIESAAFTLQTEGGNVTLSGCWPEANASCAAAPAPDATLHVQATDHAGGVRARTLPVRVDEDPPTMPDGLLFETAVPPRFGWLPFAEPLVTLELEILEGEGGPVVERTPVDATATAFVDADWPPGAARAYRLIALDRGGHEAVSAAYALPPEAVPVQMDLGAVADFATALAQGANETHVVLFDRPMQAFPRMELVVDEQVVASANGTALPGNQSAQYRFEASLPPEATATWRWAGGLGQDGAPVHAGTRALQWDLKAPTVQWDGVEDRWLPTDRHVVRVRAVDGVDPRAEVRVSSAPDTVQVNGTRLRIDGEGTHEIAVEAQDASGNAAHDVAIVRLDATPPEARLVKRPVAAAPDVPVEFMVEDALSGVAGVEASLLHDEGNFSTHVDVQDGRVRAVPAQRVASPYEVWVTVRDAAGNSATLRLGPRLHDSPDATGAGAAAPTHVQGDDPPRPEARWKDRGLTAHLDSVTDLAQDGRVWPLGLAGVGGMIGLGTVASRHKRRRRKVPVQSTLARFT